MGTIRSLLDSANKYLAKAVKAREDYYEGVRYESEQAQVTGLLGGSTAAKIAYANSLVGKTQISENKWHMEQAQTFSAAATGEAMLLLLKEQQQTNNLLAQIYDRLGEMKVY